MEETYQIKIALLDFEDETARLLQSNREDVFIEITSKIDVNDPVLDYIKKDDTDILLVSLDLCREFNLYDSIDRLSSEGIIPIFILDEINREVLNIDSRLKRYDYILRPANPYKIWLHFHRELKKREINRKLIENEERYHGLFNNARLGIAVYEAVDGGSDFVFLDFNREGEIIEGLKKEDVIGKRVTEVFPSIEEFGLLDVLRKVWRTSVPEVHSISFYKDKRISGWRENYIYKLPSGEIVASYSDETEKKQFEEEILQSEKLFRTIFENADEGMYIIDNEERKTVLYNKKFRDMLGYTDNEMWELSVDKLHPDDYMYMVNESFQKMLLNEINIVENVPVLRKDASLFYADILASLVTVNRKDCTIGFFRDVTERKKAQDKFDRAYEDLEEDIKVHTAKLEKLSVAVEQNPVSVVITDIDGNIEYVNKQFCEISRYSRGELLGQNPRLLKSEIHPKEFYEDMWAAITSGKTWRGEFYNRRKDGTFYWEESHISPILNRKGEITHFVGMKLDITEKKELEDMLYQAKLDAETANRSKSEFLANMSHEIRTPLNSILGFSQLLEKDSTVKQSEKSLNFIHYIKQSGEHLLEMINDILDLSKIEAGKLELESAPVDVHRILVTIPRQLKSLFISKKLTFRDEIADDLGVVHGDEVRIKQILYNLLSNAVKFTESGKEIGIKAWRDDVNVKISVYDEGRGISEEELDRIFRPFEQVRERGQRSEGTGLGLSITRKLVKLHGGTLHVKSKRGEGSIFTVSLPLIEGAVGKNNPLGRREQNEHSVYPDLAGLHFLVAEDNEYNVYLMKNMLNEAGIICDVVTNGIEAVKAAEKKGYDCVLMDIQMPGLNGKEAMRRVKKELNVPVIAVTAMAMKGEKKQLLDMGFDEYISKPINYSELLEKLNAIFHQGGAEPE